jgi:hypothetical protein
MATLLAIVAMVFPTKWLAFHQWTTKSRISSGDGESACHIQSRSCLEMAVGCADSG